MSLTYEEARDYILTKFKTSWDSNEVKQIMYNAGYGLNTPLVDYQNQFLSGSTASNPLALGNKPWVRPVIKHASGSQRTLGGLGNRRFYRLGLLIVQVFVPKGKDGLVVADKLSYIITNTFEGEEAAENDIWFKNVTYREIGVDGNWFQTNITAEFEYDFIK